MNDLFRSPSRLPLVAPSILSADFARLGEECAHVLGECGADLLHVDVMDGHFVPNVTLGPAVVASLRGALPEAFLDVHVMVTDPGQYVEAFAEAGANHLTFHIEPALDARAGAGMAPLSEGYDAREMAGRIHDAGMSAGIAINPATPASSVLDLLDAVDLVLVMSVNPGFSGQAFMPEVLEKTREISRTSGGAVRVEMDGGIGPDNGALVREAGCDVIVSASAVFGRARQERRGVIDALRGACDG